MHIVQHVYGGLGEAVVVLGTVGRLSLVECSRLIDQNSSTFYFLTTKFVIIFFGMEGTRSSA